ncbi:hypothetical protein E8E11_009787 [Didymella keratinophila]|nr:hypothetical protein E8E11_009787 [Didymella keratinophila]
MRFSILALALAAAAPAAAQLGPESSEYDRPDLRGSYWDVSINTQSGRPGYTITDFGATFHSPVLSKAVEGKCHYSFVPQGTSPPSTTNECTDGLSIAGI